MSPCPKNHQRDSVGPKIVRLPVQCPAATLSIPSVPVPKDRFSLRKTNLLPTEHPILAPSGSLLAPVLPNGRRREVLRLPCALPFLLNGLKIDSTLALIGAIVAERHITAWHPSLRKR